MPLDKVLARSYQAHTLKVTIVFGTYPSLVPCLPELRHGPEAFKIFSNMSGDQNISSYFDHQTFTSTVDRPEPKILNRFPAIFTLAAFHVVEPSSTRLARVHCREVGAEKPSPVAKGLLEE